MNILMVWARFFPEMGGIETHIHEISRRLSAAGHRITVLATDRSGALPPRERVGAVEVIRVAARPRTKDWYVAPGILGTILRQRWDIVHVQGYHTLVSPLAMLGSLLSRQKYVLTFHSGGHSSGFRRSLRGLQWRMLAPLVRRADALVGVSQSEVEQFSRGMDIPRNRFQVVRNGAQVPEGVAGTVPEDPDLIISMGRLERYKGHHRVIEAMPAVLRGRPSARLDVIGAGPYEQELRRLVAELDLGRAVRIFAWDPADRTGLAGHLAACGQFVLLSDYEAHPVAVMEALGLGRKVLTAHNSGFAELADLGWLATVSPDAAPEAIAQAILRGLDAPQAPAVTLPTWDEAAASLLRIYADVVDR